MCNNKVFDNAAVVSVTNENEIHFQTLRKVMFFTEIARLIVGILLIIAFDAPNFLAFCGFAAPLGLICLLVDMLKSDIWYFIAFYIINLLIPILFSVGFLAFFMEAYVFRFLVQNRPEDVLILCVYILQLIYTIAAFTYASSLLRWRYRNERQIPALH